MHNNCIHMFIQLLFNIFIIKIKSMQQNLRLSNSYSYTTLPGKVLPSNSSVGYGMTINTLIDF